MPNRREKSGLKTPAEKIITCEDKDENIIQRKKNRVKILIKKEMMVWQSVVVTHFMGLLDIQHVFQAEKNKQNKSTRDVFE